MGKSFGVAVACYLVTELVSKDRILEQTLFKELILEAGLKSAKAIIDVKSKGFCLRTFSGGQMKGSQK
jgi:hypothetical protein